MSGGAIITLLTQPERNNLDKIATKGLESEETGNVFGFHFDQIEMVHNALMVGHDDLGPIYDVKLSDQDKAELGGIDRLEVVGSQLPLYDGTESEKRIVICCSSLDLITTVGACFREEKISHLVGYRHQILPTDYKAGLKLAYINGNPTNPEDLTEDVVLLDKHEISVGEAKRRAAYQDQKVANPVSRARFISQAEQNQMIFALKFTIGRLSSIIETRLPKL